MARSIFALVVGSVALVAGGCTSGSSSDHVSTPANSDVVLQGSASTEALDAILAAQPVDDQTMAANFSWQSAGDELPVDPIPQFCWHIGSSSASAAPLPMKPAGSLPNPWEVAHPKSALNRAVTSLAHGLLDGIPEAQAAVVTNGIGFLLVFSTDSDPKLLRVFTTGTEYTPNQAAWDKITGAGALVRVNLVNASFKADKIESGGGPFKGTEISFVFPAM